jgi:beta-phosphoglucomutase family hydrolase
VADRFDLDRYEAVLFDVDGVLTDTAPLHAAAWKEMFDEFLHRWSVEHGHPFRPFRIDPDYGAFVDGKPRFEGVASFLESRRIVLPEGHPDDSADTDTIHGLSKRKNEIFGRLVRDQGVDPFEGSLRFVEHVREAGLRTAVVSSSRNAELMLETAGLGDLFDVRIDGIVAQELGLSGQPAPDTFLEGARRLDVKPEKAVVVEDAIVGIEAARLGGFGFIIGVDRMDGADRMSELGADIVVRDLGDLLED